MVKPMHDLHLALIKARIGNTNDCDANPFIPSNAKDVNEKIVSIINSVGI